MTAPRRVIPNAVPHLAGNEWKYVKECLDTNWVSSAGPLRGPLRAGGGRSTWACRTRWPPSTAPRRSTWPCSRPASSRATRCWCPTLHLHRDRQRGGLLRRASGVPRLRGDVLGPRSGARWPSSSTRECEVRGGQVVNRRTRPASCARCCRCTSTATRAISTRCWRWPGATRWRWWRTRPRRSARATAAARSAPTASWAASRSTATRSSPPAAGGMVLTRDEAMAARVRRLTTQARGDALEFVHDEIGFNYRLSNLHAALGVAQLEQLDGFVEDKRATAAFYAGALGRRRRRAPVRRGAVGALDVLDGLDPARRAAGAATCRALIRDLNAAGIQARPLWRPLHLQPAFRAPRRARSRSPSGSTRAASRCRARSGSRRRSGRTSWTRSCSGLREPRRRAARPAPALLHHLLPRRPGHPRLVGAGRAPGGRGAAGARAARAAAAACWAASAARPHPQRRLRHRRVQRGGGGGGRARRSGWTPTRRPSRSARSSARRAGGAFVRAAAERLPFPDGDLRRRVLLLRDRARGIGRGDRWRRWCG